MFYWNTFGIRLQQLSVSRPRHIFIPKRWKKNKIKKKYNAPGIYKKTDPIMLALKHFDETYAAHFGKHWPVIRLGLLSRHKYGALINNYSCAVTVDSEHVKRLKRFGAVDIVENAAEKVHQMSYKENAEAKKADPFQEINDQRSLTHLPVQSTATTDASGNVSSSTREQIETLSSTTEDPENLQQQSNTKGGDDKEWWEDQFIISPGYEGKMEEFLTGGSSQARGLGGPASDIAIIREPMDISPNLKCYVHKDEGNVRQFPRMKGDPSTGLLTYYAMDAASVLPVLSLGLKPEDSVLDLCAAPGGKALAMLQTMCVDGLRANEPSKSRRQRLNGVIQSYMPKSWIESGAISLSHEDGCEMGEMEPMSYDKVLVDVPCTTDRHSVQDPNDNLFTPYRTSERRDLPKLQRRLLCSALQAVKPGGDVVYSTCTLSQLQNDDVVETAIYTCRSQHKIKVAVVDLSPLSTALSEAFHFWESCSYGQLVLPGIRRNFGPMYFCKLRRLK